MPLHAWNCDTFTAITTVFGRVLEVEEWTEDREQTNIGRVLVLSHTDSTIFDTVCLKVASGSYTVRISEDVVEIVDFGPRYDMDDARPDFSADEESGCGDAQSDASPDISEVQETPPVAQVKLNR